MTVPHTTQFRALTTPSGKRAYEAYVTIWEDDMGDNVMIGAPTLKALAIAWDRIVDRESEPFKIAEAQHVYIIAANDEMKNAPDVQPAPAKVSCQFCGRAASFIIRKIAVCERRECKEKAS